MIKKISAVKKPRKSKTGPEAPQALEEEEEDADEFAAEAVIDGVVADVVRDQRLETPQ